MADDHTHEGLGHCGICQENFEDGSKGHGTRVGWLHCGHYFHWACITQWFKMASTCPFCKTVVSTIIATGLKKVSTLLPSHVPEGREMAVEQRAFRYVNDVSEFTIEDDSVDCCTDCLLRSGKYQGPVDAEDFCIGCDECDTWYHGVCVGIRAEADAPEDWLCPKCTGRPVTVAQMLMTAGVPRKIALQGPEAATNHAFLNGSVNTASTGRTSSTGSTGGTSTITTTVSTPSASTTHAPLTTPTATATPTVTPVLPAKPSNTAKVDNGSDTEPESFDYVPPKKKETTVRSSTTPLVRTNTRHRTVQSSEQTLGQANALTIGGATLTEKKTTNRLPNTLHPVPSSTNKKSTGGSKETTTSATTTATSSPSSKRDSHTHDNAVSSVSKLHPLRIYSGTARKTKVEPDETFYSAIYSADIDTCHSCGLNDSADDNQILFCDGCNIAVHQACYGVNEVPEGEWLCNPCRSGFRPPQHIAQPILDAVNNDITDPSKLDSLDFDALNGVKPPCIFCPCLGGVYKPTVDKRWAHNLCTTWIPEAVFLNVDTMEPVGSSKNGKSDGTLDAIPSHRFTTPCSICRTNRGAVITCSAAYCNETYHPMCAMIMGWTMVVEDAINDRDTWRYVSYCQHHTTMRGWSTSNFEARTFMGFHTDAQGIFRSKTEDNDDTEDDEENSTPKRKPTTGKRGRTAPKALKDLPENAYGEELLEGDKVSVFFPLGVPGALLKKFQGHMIRFPVSIEMDLPTVNFKTLTTGPAWMGAQILHTVRNKKGNIYEKSLSCVRYFGMAVTEWLPIEYQAKPSWIKRVTGKQSHLTRQEIALIPGFENYGTKPADPVVSKPQLRIDASTTVTTSVRLARSTLSTPVSPLPPSVRAKEKTPTKTKETEKASKKSGKDAKETETSDDEDSDSPVPSRYRKGYIDMDDDEAEEAFSRARAANIGTVNLDNIKKLSLGDILRPAKTRHGRVFRDHGPDEKPTTEIIDISDDTSPEKGPLPAPLPPPVPPPAPVETEKTTETEHHHASKTGNDAKETGPTKDTTETKTSQGTESKTVLSTTMTVNNGSTMVAKPSPVATETKTTLPDNKGTDTAVPSKPLTIPRVPSETTDPKIEKPTILQVPHKTPETVIITTLDVETTKEIKKVADSSMEVVTKSNTTVPVVVVKGYDKPEIRLPMDATVPVVTAGPPHRWDCSVCGTNNVAGRSVCVVCTVAPSSFHRTDPTNPEEIVQARLAMILPFLPFNSLTFSNVLRTPVSVPRYRPSVPSVSRPVSTGVDMEIESGNTTPLIDIQNSRSVLNSPSRSTGGKGNTGSGTAIPSGVQRVVPPPNNTIGSTDGGTAKHGPNSSVTSTIVKGVTTTVPPKEIPETIRKTTTSSLPQSTTVSSTAISSNPSKPAAGSSTTNPPSQISSLPPTVTATNVPTKPAVSPENPSTTLQIPKKVLPPSIDTTNTVTKPTVPSAPAVDSKIPPRSISSSSFSTANERGSMVISVPVGNSIITEPKRIITIASSTNTTTVTPSTGPVSSTLDKPSNPTPSSITLNNSTSSSSSSSSSSGTTISPSSPARTTSLSAVNVISPPRDYNSEYSSSDDEVQNFKGKGGKDATGNKSAISKETNPKAVKIPFLTIPKEYHFLLRIYRQGFSKAFRNHVKTAFYDGLTVNHLHLVRVSKPPNAKISFPSSATGKDNSVRINRCEQISASLENSLYNIAIDRVVNAIKAKVQEQKPSPARNDYEENAIKRYIPSALLAYRTWITRMGETLASPANRELINSMMLGHISSPQFLRSIFERLAKRQPGSSASSSSAAVSAGPTRTTVSNGTNTANPPPTSPANLATKIATVKAILKRKNMNMEEFTKKFTKSKPSTANKESSVARTTTSAQPSSPVIIRNAGTTITSRTNSTTTTTTTTTTTAPAYEDSPNSRALKRLRPASSVIDYSTELPAHLYPTISRRPVDTATATLTEDTAAEPEHIGDVRARAWKRKMAAVTKDKVANWKLEEMDEAFVPNNEEDSMDEERIMNGPSSATLPDIEYDDDAYNNHNNRGSSNSNSSSSTIAMVNIVPSKDIPAFTDLDVEWDSLFASTDLQNLLANETLTEEEKRLLQNTSRGPRNSSSTSLSSSSSSSSSTNTGNNSSLSFLDGFDPFAVLGGDVMKGLKLEQITEDFLDFSM